MSQSRKMSWLEVICSTAFGFTLAYASWIFPIPQVLGIHESHGTIFWVTAYFTVLSMLRGFIVRRFFNFIQQRGNSK